MGFKEECGVVGVWGDPEAANLIYLSLYALQHRGQEACGIVTLDSDNLFHSHKAPGLVGDAFYNRSNLDKLVGDRGVGHNRYSTHGSQFAKHNIQPFNFRTSIGPLAIAHNGNLTNAAMVRQELESEGSIFQSSSDTEVFMHLIARSKKEKLVDRIRETMNRLSGAYSLVIMSEDRLFAVRDPFGFRPLIIGKKGSATIVVSETCALDLIDAEVLREVEPGEIVEISSGDIVGHTEQPKTRRGFCSFEPIYFARPDSKLFDRRMYEIRRKLGKGLAQEDQQEGFSADIVIAVPDSGVPMAMGYSEESGLPYELGLVRNHYVGRTFIEPTQTIRDFGVKLKLNPVKSVLRDKRVVVVDDSLVRGTTSTKILRMIREAGARSIHMRIASPPITHSCYFGVDTPKRDRLLAAQKDVDSMRSYIGADSLSFLSIESLAGILDDEGENGFCYGCFGRPYPEEICEQIEAQPTDDNGPGLRSKD